jgi:hypothetical protein
MTLILEMEKSPIISVSSQDYITALTAVTTVGTAVRDILGTMQVCHTAATTTRTTHYLHIIDKIRFRHNSKQSMPSRAY